MHEVSIATGIAEIALDEASKAAASRITLVEVEIGSLAGVETEALLFAWDMVTRSTIAEGSQLQIHSIQAIAECKECGHRFPAEHFMTQCPNCESFRYDLSGGKELRTSAITVE